MSVWKFTNGAAWGVTKLSLCPQSATDATYLNGAIFDRNSYGFAQSCEAIVLGSYTVATGDNTNTQTIVVDIQHDTASNLGSATVLKTVTATVTWVSDASLKTWCVVLPADLTGANRYVRIRAKQTKAGTGTTSAQLQAQAITFYGEATNPDAVYKDAGYKTATDTVA